MKKTALILLLTALCVLLCSCGSVGYVYTDADDYTAGGASIHQRVEDIDINWLDGSVRVDYHGGSDIIISETSDRSLKRDTELHWQVDGRKLYVKYAASGFRALPNLNKQLTVLLPETLRLDDLKITVASAGVEADGINADEIHLQSASGRIALRQVGHAEEIKVDTASGGVAVAAGDTDSLKINTASGQVIVDAIQADEVKVNTASGAVTLQFSDAPDRISADSVSGNVTIRLPREAGFTADVDSLSGTVRCQQDADKRGDDTYVYGNGHCRIEADTVSGNLQVEINADAGEKEI